MSDKPAEENINFTPRRAQSNFEPALNRAPSSKSLKKDAEEADQDTTEKKVMSEKRAIKYVQSKENLLKIFKREDELLRSPENQEAFTNATDTNAQVNLLLDIKLKAINEFNVEKPKRVVEVMVNAREIFRKDPDFVKQIKEHCMYLKYDRFNPDGKVLTGDLIPKCTFYELDGSFSTLSSIVQQKPLVLFAGSYSCATLRSHVIAQNALYKDFSKSVDFAMIYISEAHAKDEWPLGTKFSWDQPKTVEDRIAIAKKFQEETKYKIPLYVDTIEGSFEKAFECWPERWWLIYKNRVAMQGISQTGDAADYEQLVLWLKVYKTTL